MGMVDDMKKNYAMAIVYETKAIALNPKLTEAYNQRGLTKYHMGKYKEAIEDYNKALQIRPKYAEPYNNRGLAEHDLGLDSSFDARL